VTGSGVVADASALVALLIDGGPAGAWAAGCLRDATILAPGLAAYEAANILRRHELAGLLPGDMAAQAHQDLLDLPIEWWPYEVLAPRAWALRGNLTVYDASYVSLAELTGTALCTLDLRLAHAPGLRCQVLTPTS
jgi:predicted nucleic acid-binding protein